MVVDTAAAGEAAGPVTDTEVAAKCPEVPEVSGAVGGEPAGAVVLLTKSFFPQNAKKSCLLSDKLPKKPCPPVLYFIMMVLLLLYTPKHNNKKLDQKIMKITPILQTATFLLQSPKTVFFTHTLKPKAREMFLF